MKEFGSEEENYEAFREFVVTVLGLSDRTATSYVSYVRGACKCIAKTVDAIISSRESMSACMAEIKRSNKPEATKQNYVSGLKAFWRFAKGSEFESSGGTQIRPSDNISYEIRKEINQFELRVSDSDANFWQRIFDVSLIVLTVIPTLLTISGIRSSVMWALVAAMILGFIGLLLLFPILHRPVRQNSELYRHGMKLANGAASGLDFTPEEKTPLEKHCEIAVGIMLPLSMLLILTAIVLTVIETK